MASNIHLDASSEHMDIGEEQISDENPTLEEEEQNVTMEAQPSCSTQSSKSVPKPNQSKVAASKEKFKTGTFGKWFTESVSI